MYTFRYALLSIFFFFIGLSKVHGQVTAVDYLIKYNPETCLYEACIVIQGGSATTYPQRIQFNASYTIVVPTGTSLSIDTLYWPKEDNATYTGTTGCLWEISSSEIAPPAAPDRDFHTAVPNLSPPSAYNNLATGDTVCLFGFSIDPNVACGDSIRPFLNGYDPSSLEMPTGGDFSNGFTLGSSIQLYVKNLESIDPPAPEIDFTIDCNGDITIAVTPKDSLMCQFPYTYVWNGPGFFSTAESPIIPEPVTPGLYDVMITDAYGCDTTIYIQVDGVPDVTANETICGAGTVTLQDLSGLGTGTWTLDPSNTTGAFLGTTSSGTATATFFANATGVYTFIYSGAGCDAETEITVAPATSVPNINNNGPLCVGDDLMLTTDFVPGATYAWTGPNFWSSSSQNPTISNVTTNEAGTYQLVVTVGGCPSSPSTTLVVIHDTPPTPIANSNSPVCEGENINLTTDAVPGATYSWTGPSGYVSSDQNPVIIGATPSSSGSYCLIVTLDGCDSEESCTDVIVNPTPPTPVVSNNGPVCEGEDINLTTDAVPGATYSWTGPSGYVSSDQNPVIIGATPSSSGSYCLIVTLNGCDSEESCTDVIVNPTPTTPVVSNNGPVCEGEDINLTTNAVPGATYSWTGPSGYVSSDQNPVIIGATPSSSGSYCLIVTLNGCDSEESCTDVIVNPTPPTPVVSNNGPVCEGEDINLTTNAVPGATYSWTGPSGYVSSDQNPVIIGATPSSSGSYCLIVTLDGCESVAGCTDVVINTTPLTPVVSSNSPLCEGETLFLDGPMIPGATYEWRDPSNNFFSILEDPSITNITVGEAGMYCLVVSVNGCPSESSCVDVEVFPKPPTPIVTSNSPICPGEDISLFTDLVPGATYTWIGPSPSSIVSNDQNAVYTGASAIAGTYCLVVSANGCDSEEVCTDITIKTTPSAPNISSNTPLCEGNDLQLTADLIAGATYSWTGPNGFTSSDQNPLLTNITIANDGIYILNIIVDGCSSPFITTNVDIYPTPAEPTPVANSPICEGDDLLLSVDEVPGANYIWTGPNGFLSFSQNPTISGASVAIGGNYCVVISLNGCDSSPGCVDVIVNPTPSTPLVSNNGPVCEGEDINLTTDAVPGATYSWTGPSGYVSSDQNPVIIGATPSSSGSYCLIMTLNGCDSEESCTDVIVNPTPSTPLVSNNGPVCEGEDINLTTDAVPGATYSWTGPSGYVSSDQNPVIIGATPSSSGSYCLIMTLNGCDSEESCTDVIVNPTPSTPLVSNNGPVCEGEDINLTTDAVPGATYSWTGPSGYVSSDQNPVIIGATPSSSGSYCLIVTLDGCESEESCTDVIVNPTPSTPLVSNNGPVCEGEDINLTTDTVPGATYSWTGPSGYVSSDQNPVIIGATPSSIGSYCLIVTLNGCDSEESCTDVIVNPTPPTPLVSNNGPVCEGEDINLTTNAVPGATYSWTGPSGYVSSDQNPVIIGATPSSSGSYCLIVTLDGCESEESCTDVIVNPTPPTPVVSNNGPVCEGEDINLTTNAVPGATYSWTGPIGYVSSDQNPVIIGATPSSSGSYCLIVTLNGCDSEESCTDVIVNPTPPTPVVSNNGPVCEGEDINLTTDAVPGATYSWTGPSGYVSSDQNPVIIGATPSSSGSYCLIVTLDGCESEESCTDVIVNPTPPTPVVSNNGPVCEGEDINLTTDAVPGATYSWTGPSGYVSSDQNPVIIGATPSSSGSYCLIVTMNGCDSEESCTDVIVNPTPTTPLVSNNGPVCEGEDINLTTDAVPGATYSWTGPIGYVSSDQNPVIIGATPSSSGSYCLIVTLDGCESEESCTDVIVNPTPPTPVVSNNGPVCEGEDINLTTDAVPGATYSWTGPSGYVSSDQNPVIIGATPSSSGSYCLIVTMNGCDSEESCTDVIVNPTPTTPLVSNNGPVCEGEDINLTTDAVPGATYSWTGPIGYVSSDQNPVIIGATPSSSGSYCLIVTLDGCDSEQSCTDVIVNLTPPTPVASNNGPICEDEDLQLFADNIAGATYSWSGPSSFTSSVQNPTISNAGPLASGTYCVFVTVDGCVSAEGCTTVEVKPTPPTPVASNNGPICEDEDLQLFTDNIAGATYSWSGPSSFTSSVQNPTISNAGPLASGTYCVFVTVDGCVSAEGCTTVEVKPTPPTPVASNNGPICEDEDLQLFADNIAGATYSWSGPSSFTSSVQNPTISNAGPLASGTYCVFVTVDGCVSAEGCTTVEVKPTPPTPVASNNGPICEDEDLQLFTDNIAGATYSWSGPSSFTSSVQNPTISNAGPLASGTYCVFVTVDGCVSAEGCTTVEVKPTPPTPVASNNGPICEDEDLQLFTDNIAGATYSWSGPSSFTSSVQNPTISNAGPLASGTYCVFVTVDGCVSAEGCTTVEVKPTPPTPVASNNGPICEDEDLQLFADNIAGATYSWSGPSSFTSSVQNPTISNAGPLASGTYCVFVTIDGCVSAEGCTTVEVKPTPPTPVASNNGPICEDEDLQLFTDNIAGAMYSWSGPSSFTSSVQNPTISNAGPLASGTYCVFVTVDGCVSAEGCTTVEVKPTPPTPVASNNGPICEDEDLQLFADNIAGATYSWSGPSSFTSSVQNPTISNAGPLASGTYCVFVTVDGCVSAEGCTTVEVKPTPPTPVANNNGPICEDEDLQLFADNITGATYSWSGPSSFTSSVQNPTISNAGPLASGTYCVFVTVDGCVSAEGCTTVEVNPTPPTPVASNNGPICEDEDLQLFADNIAGATYSWSGPSSFTSSVQNPTISNAGPLASGTYCVFVTIDGCVSAEGCTTVEVKPTPPTPVASNNGPICEDEDLQLFTDNIAGATYSWSGPSSFTSSVQNPTISNAGPLASGTYCVFVTVDGCVSVEGCTTVEVKPTPPTPVASNNGPICEDEDLQLFADNIAGATYSWSGPSSFTSSVQNPTISNAGPLASGTYCVFVTVDGCVSAEGCTTVEVKPTPPTPVASNNGPICEDEDLQLFTDNIAGATYSWSGPSSFTSSVQNPTISNAGPLASGTYCVFVTVDGCVSAEGCTTVEVKPTPTTPLASNNGPICEDENIELYASTIPGATYSWSGPSSFTSSVQNPTISNAGPLASGTYCVFVTVDGCVSSEGCTTVEVKPTPPTPVASNNGPICEDEDLQLFADNIAGATYSWSGPSSFTSSVQNPTISNAGPLASGTYCVFVTVDGCVSAEGCTTVEVKPTPTTPVASNNGPICEDEDLQLFADNIAGATYSWSGPSSFTSSVQNPTIPNAGPLASGTYCVFVTVDGCESAASCTEVVISPAISAGIDQSILCVVLAELEITLDATITSNGSWSAGSNPASVSFDDDKSHNTIIRNITKAGTYTFVWNNGICSDEVVIEITEKPNAGADQFVKCNEIGSAIMAAQGLNGTWSLGNVAGSVDIISMSNPNTAVTNFENPGLYELIWTIGDCSDIVLIEVDDDCECPIANNIIDGNPEQFCGQSIPRFIEGEEATPLGGVYQWQYNDGNGFIDIATTNSKDYTTSVLGIGTHTFRRIYTVDSPICSDTSNQLVINVLDQPLAGDDKNLTCQDLSSLEVIMDGSGTGVWNFVSGPGTATIVGNSNANTIIREFSEAGTYIFSYGNNICLDEVQITITEAANAGPDQFIECFATGTAIMAAIPNANGSWSWGTSPNQPSFDMLDANAEISGFASEGVYELIWTVGDCSDSVIITVGDDCDCPIDNNDIDQPNPSQFCGESGIIELIGSAATPDGAYTWEYSFDNGAWVNANNTNDQQNYTTESLQVGKHRFRRKYETTSAPICTDFSNIIEIEVLDQPDAGSNQSLSCIDLPGGSVVMNGSAVGTWSALPTNLGSVNIVNENLSNTEINGFTLAGSYGFVLTNGICKDTVFVDVSKSVDAGPDQTVDCYVTGSATMSVVSGIGTWSVGFIPVSASEPNIVSAGSPNTSVDGFDTPGTYQLIWTDIATDCSDEVLIEVGEDCACPISGNNLIQPVPSVYCDVSPMVVIQGTEAAPNDGNYTWEYEFNGGGFTIANGNQRDYTTLELAVGVHSFRRIYCIDTPMCCDTSNVVIINVIETPDAGIDQTLDCITFPGSVTMNATGTGMWTENNGNPSSVTIIEDESATTTIEGFTFAGEYFFTYANGNCTDEVKVTVSEAADAGSDQNVNCFLTGTASLSATGMGTWTYGSTTNNDQPAFTMTNANTTISGFAGSGTYELIWTSNGCSDTIIITVGDDCSCPIGNNVITQPIPDEFCFESDDVLIMGSIASPSGGAYIWESSNDGTNYSSASGTTDQPNYSTGILGIGEHFFRRIYDLDSPDCSDTSNVVSIVVYAQPDAGEDQTFSCVEIPTSINMDGTGPGVWTANTGNPSSVSIITPSSATTEVAGLVSGDYFFTFTNSICTDEVMISITAKSNAGVDQTFDCFETTTAVMNASGSGSWSWGVTPSNDQPTLDSSNPNAAITGFLFEGDYELIWTNADDCVDTVVITLGAICDCPIANNIIDPPNPSNFCELSTQVIISGTEGTPANGTYIWQYSSDGVVYADATFGIINQRDYTTDVLPVGVHRFRRIYTVIDPIACEDISNFVSIEVFEGVEAGPDQSFICYEDAVATMAATGSGSWSWVSSLEASIDVASNPNATIDNFPMEGTYELMWTSDDGGCTDVVSIIVGANCACPIENNTITQPDPSEFCGVSELVTILGTDAIPVGGTYSWEYSFNNGGFGTAGGANTQRDYTTGALGVGEHRFRRIYSIDSPIDCDNISNVVLIIVHENADAGPDQSADCFEDGIVTMSANGAGTWSWVSSDIATINVVTDPNATISDFPQAGTYELMWTTDEGNCTDVVSIVVGANCNCPIENNTITQPDPSEFCGVSELVTILGSDATPSGGTYSWEYSFNNGGFGAAGGANTQRDYTTGALGVGEHRFRRIYSIDSPIDCDNISNVVLIIVHENADAGPDQSADCFEDGIVTMSANGAGSWSWVSSDIATINMVTDPNATISDFPQAGTYELMWTADEGNCTDVVSIVVGANCNCPIENNTITQPDPSEFCGVSELVTILGTDAIPVGGTYSWEYSFNNGGFGTAGGANTQRDYTTGALGVGEHSFRRIYSIDSPIDCDNISNVVLIIVHENADAGPDQSADCFEDGIVTMSANGAGTWSWVSSDIATINMVTDPNATISDFPQAGTYELMWTTDEGNCTDVVSIVVGANCNCPIENNTITQPDPSEFCGVSELVTILGSDATPSGGTYSWEYSFNNGGFGAAGGANTQRDYTTGALGVGEHRFRRIYSIESPIDCDNISNVVLIIVHENAEAGPNQSVDCYEDGVATMAATGTGTWTWVSSDVAVINGTTNANATISGFPQAGIYELMWTTDDGECTDVVLITVGGDCVDCEIMNNDIVQPIPSEYCEISPNITIIGESALPINGDYTWEYSFNGSPFVPAPGNINQSNYDTSNLGVGEHRFRRRYLIQLNPICEDVSNIVVIDVIAPIQAGDNQDLGCTVLEDVLVNMAANGEGTWTQSSTNPSQVIFSNVSEPNAILSGFAAPGVYTFMWTNGICEDEMSVSLEETKDAGEDQLVACFVDGVVILNAEGIGTWSISSNNPGAVEISSLTDPKAVLTNFSIDGLYEFIWTVNGCDDSVLVEVGEACPCIVESNNIIDDISDIFCLTTGELIIIGDEAIPAGGDYLWQISINGSGFSNAPGINNTKDYDASNFIDGTYMLRRQYTLNIDGVECIDISEEVEFFVFDKKQDPGEITYTPNPVCLGDSLILVIEFNPELTYDWQITSGGGRVLYSLDSMSMIIVESPGTITVTVTQSLEGCDNNLVSTASEIDITVLDSPKPDLGQDTTFCELDETFIIYPGEFVEYEWHDGSTDPEFEVEGEGIYTLSVVDTMGCVGMDMVNIKSFCCEFVYPNIFRADSRGKNSEFKVTDIYDCVIESELYIYDRWGNLVFVGDGLESWDGTFRGEFVEQGVYAFIYKYKAMDADRSEFEDAVSGDITVLR